MKVTLHNQEFTRGWNVSLSRSQAMRLDNGHLVSIGLIVGEDIQESTLKRWEKSGKAVEIDAERANHSACQSRCIRRGDSICQW